MPRVREIFTDDDKKRKKAEWNKHYYEKHKKKLIEKQLKLYREKKSITPDDENSTIEKLLGKALVDKLELLKQQQLELNQMLRQIHRDFENGIFAPQ